MKPDFKNIQKDVRIGAVFAAVLFITIVSLICAGLYSLQNEINGLELELKEKDKSIAEIKKTSYNRFILAKDLTTICDKFKSSREAKFQYNLKSKIIIN